MLRSDLHRLGGGEALEADESAGAAAIYAIASFLPATFPKNDPSVKESLADRPIVVLFCWLLFWPDHVL